MINPHTGLPLGPLDLLVIQPTPFCNIDCSYCYLPERLSRRQISEETLEQLFERVFTSGLVERPVTVIWHAGEPLVVPPQFYERAFAIEKKHNRGGAVVQHSLQTNATLIHSDWCRLFKEHDVRLGVSVDGPEFLHDRYRKTRSGQGTWRRVMDGIRLLNQHEVPFSVITVLTRDALDYPDELFEFYRENGIWRVGFNVEEVEGPHQSTSLDADDVPSRLRRFLGRFFDLVQRDGPHWRIREFDSTIGMLMSEHPGAGQLNHQTTPYAIISVDCEGRFSSYSPELLGLKSWHYGDFELGRVQTDDFLAAAATDKFRAVQADIAAGVEQCCSSCRYFAYCGGGSPGNKYFENGRFDSSETLFCRLSKQAVVDVVLERLEQGARPVCALPTVPVPT